MKRFFPFILAASLAVTGCSKSDGPVGDKDIDRPISPLEILIEKLQKALPELKGYPVIGLNEESENGNYIVGGLNNESYLFSLVSKEMKVVLKSSNPLDAGAKVGYKRILVSSVKGFDKLFYFLLSDGGSQGNTGHLTLINVYDDKVFPIRNNDVGMESLSNLKKSHSIISFIAGKKLLLYSQKGELLNTISSYATVEEGGKYVIINKDQLVKASFRSDGKFYLKNLNIATPFGKITTNWNKSYSIFDWSLKNGETRNVEFEISDDVENAVIVYTAKGRRYDTKGDLQDYTESGTIKVNKSTGNLIQ